jgi:hypothetical protein
MKKLPCLVLAALLAVPASAMAQEIIWDGPFSEYGQRKDSVTVGAGNAKEANSAIHTVDPSPPAARNRNIPGSGERMSRAIRRYQDVTKLTEAARALASETAVSGGSSGSSGSSSSGK